MRVLELSTRLVVVAGCCCWLLGCCSAEILVSPWHKDAVASKSSVDQVNFTPPLDISL